MIVGALALTKEILKAIYQLDRLANNIHALKVEGEAMNWLKKAICQERIYECCPRACFQGIRGGEYFQY